MKKKKVKKLFKVAGVLIILLLIIYVIVPDKTNSLHNFGKVIYDREGRIIRTFLNSNEQWCFKPQNGQIPYKLEKSVLLFEDKYFYSHLGVNPLSICKALGRNIKAGEVVSGGSTITMQVCRMAEPGKRTILKKLLETMQAVKLEIKYTKKEILQMYLNNAPYGGNIQGIRAASLKYFGREPGQLSWSEAAMLAVLPNEPARVSPAGNSEKLLQKRNRLLEKLHEEGEFDDLTLTGCLNEPLPQKVHLLPQNVLHLTDRINIEREDTEIHTTIDLSRQAKMEDICREEQIRLSRLGIKNLSLLITDNQSGEILCWIGSADYWDWQNSGQVDGVTAVRSAGSTLKPFLYGLAFDEGICCSETRLEDVPTYYRTYSPENAGENYSGWVTARQTLVQSLNVPAVGLLYKYGLEPFYNWLQQAGVTLARPAENYGLVLVIGGCEITMLELAALYSGLANYGSFKPLHYLQNSDETNSKRLLSEGASWQVLEILSELERPGSENYWQNYENQWQLAWKTGTSYGFRDAWAAGCNPQYTICVWSGNFDGSGNNSLQGITAAAPLLFSVFNALAKDGGNAWFVKPEEKMEKRTICHETGLSPSAKCPCDTIEVPIGSPPLPICSYHRAFQVTDDGKYTVCSLCWQDKPHHEEVFLVYPPQIKKYLEKTGRFCQEIPPHYPECPSQSVDAVKIIYPVQGAKIYLPLEMNGERQKLSPQVSVNNENLELFWYVDDKYAGTSTGKESLSFSPQPGWHTLSVIDANGGSDSRHFEILP